MSVSLIKDNGVSAWADAHRTVTIDDKISLSDLTADHFGWPRFAPKIDYVRTTPRRKINNRRRRFSIFGR